MAESGDSSALARMALVAEGGLAGAQIMAISGSEGIDQPFLLQVECLADSSSLSMADAIGQHATVTICHGDTKRLLDGMCAAIRHLPHGIGTARYVLELRPWLWWLTLSADNRIFQSKSVPDIVEAVFAAHGYRDYELKLNASYAARDYCVQYGESDFNFVVRLLEEEGIFYFFRHEEGRHVMVLADGNDTCSACPGPATIDFMPPQVGSRELQAVRSGEIGQQAVSQGFRTTDYAFITPATSLYSQAASGSGKGSVYDYPGRYDSKSAADAIAKRRLEALAAHARMLDAESDCRGITAGYTFTLAGHEREDCNTEWLVTEVQHQGDHEQYRNRFTALPLASAYRPQRKTVRPRIPGSQTALVVGKAGEEIWTDEHGRVKVQFHWDRDGKSDENSSCWMRVAQMWSGKSWGVQFIPRIGQEVVISFLDGDPDRPLVTGCVYNGSNTLPYALPAEQTKSALKTQSSKGGGGFNEIRFEDKKDAEELYLHAQKDMTTDVLHDATRSVGNDDTLKVEQNQSITLAKGNRSAEISTGNDSLSVKGTRSVKVEGNEDHKNLADFTQDVDGNYKLIVQGNLTIEASGSISFKAGQSMASEAGTALSNKAGTALTNKAGTDLTNEGGITLTSKAGASQTVDGGGMLTLKGGLVKIN